jgi:hypothetical protein
MENLFLSPVYLFLIIVWTIPWKGVALWKAARNSHKKWFIAIFLLNTMALLEMIYIFYFAKKTEKRP